MDQLEQIRIEKHKEYLRRTWLPEFFEKYKPYFDQETKAKKIIYRFIKKYGIPDVINPEHLEHIPGIFRVRLKITNETRKRDKKYTKEYLSFFSLRSECIFFVKSPITISKITDTPRYPEEKISNNNPAIIE